MEIVSSGNSQIFLSEDGLYVIKQYNRPRNEKLYLEEVEKIKKEVRYVKELFEAQPNIGIVKLKEADPSNLRIVYERVDPVFDLKRGVVKEKYIGKSIDILRDIFITLNDIHLQNFCFDDTGLANIGYRESEDKFVLYDFEELESTKDIPKNKRSECEFNGFINFLENAEIHFKETQEYRILLGIHDVLKRQYVKEEKKMVSSFGKQTLRTIKIYNYKTGDIIFNLQNIQLGIDISNNRL